MGNATAERNGSGKAEDIAPAPAPAPASPSPALTVAEARRQRAAAQMTGATKQVTDPTTRYTLTDGEVWHELPTGGKVGITTSESGVETVVEISGQQRVKRGVSVAAITALIDAERI